jgi:hypothetical protein
VVVSVTRPLLGYRETVAESAAVVTTLPRVHVFKRGVTEFIAQRDLMLAVCQGDGTCRVCTTTRVARTTPRDTGEAARALKEQPGPAEAE